jgi:hypothetical protein
MTNLTNHFWIVALLFMYVNLAIGRVRMRTLIGEGRLSELDANRFCVKAAIALAVVCGALEVVSLASGISPLCEMVLPITDKALWPSYLLTFASGGALLYWVWKRDGDRTLAVVGPAFTRGSMTSKKYTPGQVRVGLTTFMALAWGGYVVMRLALPLPSEMPGCPGQPPSPRLQSDGASPRL